VREQRSMIASTYKQFVKAGGAQTFAHFVEPRGKQNWRVPQFDFRHFEYHHLIRYYRSLFGADRVLVLPYEQLVGDPRAFVARIGDFAGRPLAAPLLDRLPYGRNLNPSPSALTVAALRRLNRFAPRNELNPAPIVELDAAERLADWMKAGDVLSRGPAAGLAARAEARLRSEVEQAVGTRRATARRRSSPGSTWRRTAGLSRPRRSARARRGRPRVRRSARSSPRRGRCGTRRSARRARRTARPGRSSSRARASR